MTVSLTSKFLAGQEYFGGSRPGGITKANDAKALSYFMMAAEEGEPAAQAKLGYLYNSRCRDIVETSPAEARRWYDAAASNGHLMAHATLANMYRMGRGGERSAAEANRLLTFAARHDVGTAQGILASSFLIGSDELGIPVSLERAKYWFSKIVRHTMEELERGNSLGSFAEYGKVLLMLQQQNLDGVVDIAGASAAPEAMYWLRKAAEVGDLGPEHTQMMEILETLGRRQCMNCKVRSAELTRCARCQWAHFCGKECQVRIWDNA